MFIFGKLEGKNCIKLISILWMLLLVVVLWPKICFTDIYSLLGYGSGLSDEDKYFLRGMWEGRVSKEERSFSLHANREDVSGFLILLLCIIIRFHTIYICMNFIFKNFLESQWRTVDDLKTYLTFLNILKTEPVNDTFLSNYQR